MEFSNCRIRTKVFPDAPFYLSLLHLELCKQVWKRRASRWLSFDFWLRRAAACSISSTCKLLFFPDNKGCVLYITKCNHPPPPRSFVWSTPPQNSAVDSPDNRASCVIVEGFYYYYSSLENEKFQVQVRKWLRHVGSWKDKSNYIRQILAKVGDTLTSAVNLNIRS